MIIFGQRACSCDPFRSQAVFLLSCLLTWYVDSNMFSHGVRGYYQVRSQGNACC